MDRARFESLAIAELDGVYRFARFLTRDAPAAEELVQDVYARAFRPGSIESFREQGGGMRPWLLTLARRLFYARAERGRTGARIMAELRHEHSVEGGSLESPDAEVVSRVDWARARPLLMGVMASLSAELREALWLWSVAGLTYREIAEALDIPIGTVMSRLHRARARATAALLAHPDGFVLVRDAGLWVGAESRSRRTEPP